MSIKTVFLKLRFGGVLHPRSVGAPLNSLTHNLARNISITLQATPPALPSLIIATSNRASRTRDREVATVPHRCPRVTQTLPSQIFLLTKQVRHARTVIFTITTECNNPATKPHGLTFWYSRSEKPKHKKCNII